MCLVFTLCHLILQTSVCSAKQTHKHKQSRRTTKYIDNSREFAAVPGFKSRANERRAAATASLGSSDVDHLSSASRPTHPLSAENRAMQSAPLACLFAPCQQKGVFVLIHTQYLLRQHKHNNMLFVDRKHIVHTTHTHANHRFTRVPPGF